MRTLCWVSLSVLLGGPVWAAEKLTLSAGKTVELDASRGRMRLLFGADGAQRPLTIATDDLTAPGPAKLNLVAEDGDGTVVLTDTHPSKPGGMSLCRAGKETFLRIVTISPARPDEIARIKVGSCLDNIELAENGLSWDKASSTLNLSWISGPLGAKGPQSFKITLGAQPGPSK